MYIHISTMELLRRIVCIDLSLHPPQTFLKISFQFVTHTLFVLMMYGLYNSNFLFLYHIISFLLSKPLQSSNSLIMKADFKVMLNRTRSTGSWESNLKILYSISLTFSLHVSEGPSDLFCTYIWRKETMVCVLFGVYFLTPSE